MKDVVFVVASVCLYFGGAILVSYCLFWYFGSRQSNPRLAENASVRLVGPGGTYRCHFLREDNELLVFSNPLQADRYVPIRTGEKLMVCSAAATGFVTFRSEVIERDPEKHELKMGLPHFIKKVERRGTPRLKTLASEDVLLDGEPAEIVDHSSMGMCVIANERPDRGAVVHICLPSQDVNAFGWALEAVPAAFGKRPGFRVHVQFQEEQTFSEKATRRREKVR